MDAAVATAFALAVTEPTQSGLGGRTQALVWRPDGPPLGIDATNEVPASYDPDTAEQVEDGYGVIAIPGTVAGLTRLHATAGSLPLPRLITPAIALAERGFSLSEGEAQRLADIRVRLLLSDAASSAFLAEDGSAYAAGDTLRQPVLAEVLRAIADGGPDAFYEGWIADRMVADFATHDGHVTAKDVAIGGRAAALLRHHAVQAARRGGGDGALGGGGPGPSAGGSTVGNGPVSASLRRAASGNRHGGDGRVRRKRGRIARVAAVCGRRTRSSCRPGYPRIAPRSWIRGSP